MRIVMLTPGAGGTFYCENCLRDAGLIRALRKAGHDVEMSPLYLPMIGKDFEGLRTGPLFFGGVNVFLQQKLALFRRTPRWVDRLFDSRRLLRWAAGKAGATNPRDLGETTLSMLRGPSGRQAKELARLADYLADSPPDVVYLSNALLIGLADEISSRTGAAVVVMCQDEDIFLDELPAPYCRQAWQQLSEQARRVDALVAVSQYYADRMCDRLSLSADRVQVVHSGIDIEAYRPSKTPPRPQAIGFIERFCPAMGLDILVEAFIKLKRTGRFDDLQLHASGGYTDADKPFVHSLRDRLERAGLAEQAKFNPNLDQSQRAEFLRGLSVLAAPTRHAEAFGLYVLEAMATGVPVVLPNRGAFCELVEATSGGLIYDGDDSEALAGTLEKILTDADLAGRLAHNGRQAVAEKFTLARAAEQMLTIFNNVVDHNN